MPNYEIEHICPLTESQKDEIAEAITRIHTEQFKAPRLFVNCRFTNIKDHAVYVAGKRVGLSCDIFSIRASFSFSFHCSVQWPYISNCHDATVLVDDILTQTQRTSNRIFAYVRHGPSRTQADYQNVSEEIIKAWNRIVPLPMTKRAETTPDTELRMVMFFGMLSDKIKYYDRRELMVSQVPLRRSTRLDS